MIAVDMQDEIVDKLRKELNLGITTEPQVVYLMAGIRKLIEHDNAQGKYPALNFYCNWVLHTKLDRGFAKSVITLFDRIYGAQRAGNREELEALWKEMHALTDGGALCEQLGRFLREKSLPDHISTDMSHWRMFLSLYASAINDTPLEFEIPVQHIKKVVVNKLPAERRAGGGAETTTLIPFRDAFNITWTTTSLAGEEEMAMSISFPEEWLPPVPRLAQ